MDEEDRESPQRKPALFLAVPQAPAHSPMRPSPTTRTSTPQIPIKCPNQRSALILAHYRSKHLSEACSNCKAALTIVTCFRAADSFHLFF